MNKLQFLQLTKCNVKECKTFENMILAYSQELDEHLNRKTPAVFLQQWIFGTIQVQGKSDRHLELCYNNGVPMGFFYCKIDRQNHRGFIKPNYGHILEFYVKPEYRLKGYGREMYNRLESLLKTDGAKNLYLTADPVTGIPFWEAMGFTNTNEVSPENKLYIFEKQID